VQIGPGEEDEVLGRKVRNDAAAYVRALAEGHGRNPDLAERMVRDADTTERLRQSGWLVLRFWEHENAADVAERVRQAVTRQRDLLT
jgi:membrane-bound ClpP family serine protease